MKYCIRWICFCIFVITLSSCSSRVGVNSQGELRGCDQSSNPCLHTHDADASKVIEALAYEGGSSGVIFSLEGNLKDLGATIDVISGNYLSAHFNFMGIPWIDAEFLLSSGFIEMRFNSRLFFDFGETNKKYQAIYQAFTGESGTTADTEKPMSKSLLMGD